MGAEFFTELSLQSGQRGLDFLGQRRGVVVSIVVIVGAHLGGEGEPGRDRQSDASHFCEIGTFAAQEFPKLRMAVGLFAEVVAVLDCFTRRPRLADRAGLVCFAAWVRFLCWHGDWILGVAQSEAQKSSREGRFKALDISIDYPLNAECQWIRCCLGMIG